MTVSWSYFHPAFFCNLTLVWEKNCISAGSIFMLSLASAEHPPFKFNLEENLDFNSKVSLSLCTGTDSDDMIAIL